MAKKPEMSQASGDMSPAVDLKSVKRTKSPDVLKTDAESDTSVGIGDTVGAGYSRGGKVKKMANGGSASSRADGIAIKGKTRGKMC